MYYGKEVRVFLKEQAKESYLELKKRNDKEAESILNSIERVKSILNYWRMLYTIEGNNVEILLFVLSIVDHKGYNKLFGYK